MVTSTFKYGYAFIIISLTFFLATCHLERIDPTVKYDPCYGKVEAKFSSNKPSVGVTCDSPCVIKFYNQSKGAKSYVWDFGDGVGKSTSSLDTLIYSFKNKGAYDVKLTATGENGCIKEYTEKVTVDFKLTPDPIADFTFTTGMLFAPATVTFTNTSQNANDYDWYVNNVPFSILNNPTYTFTQPGDYSIKLVAKSGAKVSAPKTQIVTIKLITFDLVQAGFGPAKKVIALPTGEFVVAGTNYTGAKSVAYIFKTDTLGKIIPSFTKIFSLSDNNEVYDLIQLSDGSFGICGSTLSINKTNTDAFFARVKVNGTTDTTRFGDINRDGFAQSMVEATDGYVIFCGYENAVATKNDLWLSKRNPNLPTDLRFNKTYPVALNEQGYKVVLSANGDLMVLGTSTPTSGPVQSFFFRTDANGNQLSGYPKTIGLTTDYNYGRNMAAISTNRLLISGTIYVNSVPIRKGWLTLADANGVGLSSFTSNFGTDTELTDAQEFTKGTITGFVGVGLKANGAWFLKTSASGVTQVDTTYGTVGTNIFNAIRSTSDGGFIMVGEKNGIARILKTDANGR
jgi:PKD repeat protein